MDERRDGSDRHLPLEADTDEDDHHPEEHPERLQGSAGYLAAEGGPDRLHVGELDLASGDRYKGTDHVALGRQIDRLGLHPDRCAVVDQLDAGRHLPTGRGPTAPRPPRRPPDWAR